MSQSRQKSRIALLCIALFFLCRCASRLASRDPEIIEVKYERIYLKPFSGIENLEMFEGWPQKKQETDFLLQEITLLWKTLLAEFRRCEKYGLYTVVDSTGSSTVIITPQIVSVRILKDTLFMPIELKILNASHNQKKTMAINTLGICIPKPSDTTVVQKLSIALSDYRRQFPYKETVSLFYTPPIK